MKQFKKVIRVIIAGMLIIITLGGFSEVHTTKEQVDALYNQMIVAEQQYMEIMGKEDSALTIVALAQELKLDTDSSVLQETTQLIEEIEAEKATKSKNLKTITDSYYSTKAKYEKSLEVPQYTEEELDLLAKVIHSEAGSSWLSDEHQLLVGSVVLNRVKSDQFPNSIKEVIFQVNPVQYSSAKRLNGFSPDERTVANAKLLLDGLQVCPENVLYQANFKQGKRVYKVIDDSILGKTYFCES